MHLKEFENFNYQQFLQLKSDLMEKSKTDNTFRTKKSNTNTQNSIKTSTKKEIAFEKNTRTAFEKFYSSNIISPVHEHIKERKFSCVRLILKMTPEHEDFFKPPNDVNKHYLITNEEQKTSYMNCQITYKYESTMDLVEVIMTSNSKSQHISIYLNNNNENYRKSKFGFYICKMKIRENFFLYFKSIGKLKF